jgi:hypothetical protein
MSSYDSLRELVGVVGEHELLDKASEARVHLLLAEAIYRETGKISSADFPAEEDDDENSTYYKNSAAFGAAERAFVDILFIWLQRTIPHLEALLREKLRGVDPRIANVFVKEMFNNVAPERLDKISSDLAENSLIERKQKT